MAARTEYLAIDLGASSGRAVLGTLAARELTLREVGRFPNGPVELPTGLHWDALGIFRHIKQAMKSIADAGSRPAGIGIDTWGVDYGLLSESGELLAPPHHYRDPRTHGMMELAFARVPRETIYARTGIQFMQLNTVYQLLADQQLNNARLTQAASLLFMPDLLAYWLTGIQRTEATIASTSQLYDPSEHCWALDLVQALELPARLLPPVSSPGATLGPLLPSIASETGLGSNEVAAISPGSHDTASAVAAVPALDDSWAYVSSGTWSLVGREIDAPIRTPAAMAANFTNECGIDGAIRFHKNVAGLWLLQECQRVWNSEGHRYTFEQLAQLAMQATPFASLVDPDDAVFAEFGDMPARLREYCVRTRQRAPDSHGAVVRCILESLALKCRSIIDTVERFTSPVRTIHIVGGGSRNMLLCQFTADACARRVLAGPVEATAIGNIMTQAMAQGLVASRAEIRQVIAASSPPEAYEPQNAAGWDAARARLNDILARTGD